jgi:hypothetical protein
MLRPFCIILALPLLLPLIFAPCHAKRAYMWTDEQGVAHITDQAPPKGVEARSFSMERDNPKVDAGVAEAQGEAASQLMESKSREKDPNPQNDSNQSGSTHQGPEEGPQPKYRDEASLSRDDKMQLLLLEASKEHASKLYNTASSDDERRRWKAELDKIQVEENKILEVGSK